MKKVVFYEVFDEEKDALEKFLPAGLDAVFMKGTIQEQRKKDLPAPVISIRTQSMIPLAWAKGLIGILTRSAGYDHVKEFREKSRAVFSCGYLPSYCARAVAEQAIMMCLALWRNLPQQMKQFHSFSRDGIMGQECLGKNLLVVGVGRIGGECARIASALGMNVKGVDIDRREKETVYVDFKEGMAWADAVISAVPLTEETRNMFNENAFQKMKKGIFVNVSRGEVSSLECLRSALAKGWLSGAGLDVYENEPSLAVDLRSGHKSEQRKMVEGMMASYNVVFTPHNAFNTAQAVDRKAQQSMASLACFFEKGRFIDEVPV
jgi:D-lactate dehydrogenase